jgi:hypothetical protein
MFRQKKILDGFSAEKAQDERWVVVGKQRAKQ